MKRRIKPTSSIILLIPCWLLAENNQPNIIIFLADDQGWGDLSFNGNKDSHTPNIDQIAIQGAHFTNFYVCPVSSPTRAELLTGKYAARVGVCGVSEGFERLNEDEKTIAQYLKEAGYSTAAFGKWHNGTQHPYHPNNKGFEEFYGFCSGHWGNYWNPMLEHNGSIVQGEGFIIDDLTNKAIAFIKKKKTQPFFAYIPYNTPHSPMQMPDRVWNKVKNRKLTHNHSNNTDLDTLFTKAAYGLNENLDWNVGRILSTLEQEGIAKNTIVIYMSDNGPNSGRWNAGMKGQKGSTDEGGVRSPLFIRWPEKITPGSTINTLSGAIDILPTLIIALGGGLDKIKNLDGNNIGAGFSNGNYQTERTLHSHWGNKHAVRWKNYLLDSDEKLYDLKIDRNQLEVISEKQPQIASFLRKEKKKYQAEVIDRQQKNNRPFTIGHPKELFSKLPARDGIAHGSIERSNRYPNSSYFTNWLSSSDSITWDVEVIEDGQFSIEVYYTCSNYDIGSTIQLNSGDKSISFTLKKPNDQPMIGAELDRVPRKESYTKGFEPYFAGIINLKKGRQIISIQATNITGESVMDLQMIIFKRIQ